ncbi:uncharacterized protein NMK_2390 [Novimethylophilus kurashikiensis]|uniref:Cyclic GMP-AMP synthase n=1 Tax=Novimethylophilus kurashikiensis TaxID=1825523 RepID=A0A2R5FAD9_9PROT|nr:hypothetical protein [Novimethylophilus kurashikiensis]GBG14789.1 uncharacterized protein NMK_2390 [Novimethylophilus kurashikiensis]
MLNLSSLFYSTTEAPIFLNNITLEPDAEAFMASAREDVRQCLRKRLPEVLHELGHDEVAVSPRFFPQGSWSYKTLNKPAWPQQQADIDDGVYLPLSFVQTAGRPSVASAVFFQATQTALAPLVKAKHWKLITNKPTCIRIEIAANAHLDIPLYAIPDKEFETLSKAALAKYGYDSFAEALLMAERDAWTELPQNQVLLAHREEDWIESDPRQVTKWFRNQVEIHGEQFRRCVRYLKAWRDFQWESGGPSSILLMAAAALHFEKRERRDDLALLDVVAKLPAAFRAGIDDPVDSSKSLTDRLGTTGVKEVIAKLETLERFLRGALNASDSSQACTWVINQLGKRFPNQPSRIVQAGIAATVLAAPATVQASKLVGRSQAG